MTPSDLRGATLTHSVWAYMQGPEQEQEPLNGREKAHVGPKVCEGIKKEEKLGGAFGV